MNELSKHAVTGGFAYLYTYIIQNNTVYFTASSYATNDVKYNTVSHYWTDYPEAKPVFLAAIQSDQPLFDTYSDRWGTFRSVLIHFQSPKGNNYVAAADIEISIIERSLRWRVFVVIIISIAMLTLALPFLRVFTRTYAAMNSELLQLNKQLNQDIERSRIVEEELRQRQKHDKHH
jgi:methyl-accepting chemotaxis protein